jgi:cardiolipin synthase (CMP-forming)
MTMSMERLEARLPLRAEKAGARSTEGPTTGQNVPEVPSPPDDPGTRALKGVLWSLTVARVVLVPVFLVGAFRLQDLVARGVDPSTIRWGLVLTLGVMAASDMLDGWVARRFGLASEAGAIADALADKLAQVALVAFFTFASGPPFAALPIWFLVLLVGRDLLLGSGWLVLRAAGVPFEVFHHVLGRAATAGVFATLLWLTIGIESDVFWAVLMLTAALIWTSLAAYLADAWTAVRRARRGGAHSDRKEVTP